MADSGAEFPAVISHYRLDAEIGRGGMGSVYHGIDQRDNSPVAVKLLREELRNDPTFRERFEREAHVGALLRSPYTVHLLDYGFADPHYFLVMDFVEGESLRERLASGPLEAGPALRIASNVARALEEADARGVVHRDIKPDNVMLGNDGSARVLDFGIARQAGTLTLTQAGGFIGSLQYASPEHATGTVDHRSDIYSLGATLFQMLAGHPPFQGDAIELLEHHRRTPMPEAPLAHVPAAAVSVVARCLEKEPGRRYQSATELSVALAHAVRLVEDQAASAAAATETPVAPAAPQETVGATVAADGEAAEPAATVGATPNALAPTTADPSTPPTQAASAALSLQLSPLSASRFAGLRTGSMRGTLTATNPGASPVVASLVANDPDDVCEITLAGRVEVPPAASVQLPIKVRPRTRRWRGPTERRSINVVAEGDGPPSRVETAFDDAPLRWPMAGGGLLSVGIVAIVLVMVLAGGGGSDEPEVVTDATAEPSAEEVETAPTVTDDPEISADETESPDDPEPGPGPGPTGFLTSGGGRIEGEIAFISDRAGSDSLYTMRADGTGLKVLTSSGSTERGPDWSPDGLALTFASDQSGDFDIWTIGADGDSLARITTDPAFDGRPAWAPNGAEIAFVSTRSGNHDIFVINSDGSGLRQITADAGTDFRPTWSSDGREIAFSSTRGGSLAVWKLRLGPQFDESDAVRLTSGAANDGEPSWAPDGSLIAFESDRDGNSEIYVMAPDGSGQRRLTMNAGADLEPAWTPDSRFVVFMSLRDGNANLFLVEIATGEISQITTNPGFDGDPAWHAIPPATEATGNYRAQLRAISEEAEAATAPLLAQIGAAPSFAAQLAAIDEVWPGVIGIGSDALRQFEALTPPPEFEADQVLLEQGLRDILDAELELITVAAGGDFEAVGRANDVIRALTVSVRASFSDEFRPLVDALFR